MSAYIIANVDITNPEQYEDYKKLSTLAMQTYGVEVVARGGKLELLEGEGPLPGRVVILKFPTMEAARTYNDSVEYTRARESRQGAAVMKMILVEGV